MADIELTTRKSGFYSTASITVNFQPDAAQDALDKLDAAYKDAHDAISVYARG